MNWFHDLFIQEAKPALDRHSGGGEPINNQDKTITQNGTYTADEGFTGLGTVNVNVAREDQTDIAVQRDGIIDKSITEISSNVTSIGDYAFHICEKLTTANFPLATSIGSDAFYACRVLTTANFPLAKSIGLSAFNRCGILTTANFPLAKSIGNNAFQYSRALATIDLPAVTSIGDYAFGGCKALTTLILRSETRATLSNMNAFTNTPIASGTGYIYVPSALVETYKAATNWSTYANQFRALEDYTVDGTITGALDSTKI